MFSSTLRPAQLILALALATGTPMLAAQPSAALVEVALPAQALAQSLNELARQAGLSLIVQSELIAGRQAPEVRGTIPVHEALDRLLAGTGLQAHIESDSVVISAQAPVAQLSQVTVTGSEQTATGPVYGSGARRT